MKGPSVSWGLLILSLIMLLDAKKAVEVFQKIKQIQDEYATYVLGGATNYISIEDLQAVIESMYGIKITKKEVAYDGEFLRGLIERYDDNAIIRVRAGMADDNKRFTAVKEMCHVVIDEEEDWSVNGVETIKDLIVEYSVQNDEQPQKATQSEVFAEIAATELLYPFDNREADARKLAANETTHTAIATYHKMPVYTIQRAHAEWYKNMAGEVWGLVSQRVEA